MTLEQATRMIALLDSLVKLALVPFPPDFYRPEEECELDPDNIFSLSRVEGDVCLEGQGVPQCVKCEITMGNSREARMHYKRLEKALSSFDGLKIVSYHAPRFDSDENYHILLDLEDHNHIREVF